MKKFILWNYARGTRQYDIFCLLIVAFIFLTPKSWFDKTGRVATQTAFQIVKPFGITAPIAEKPVSGEKTD